MIFIKNETRNTAVRQVIRFESKLNEARSIARAKAQEDFEFFATHVLGLRLSSRTCRETEKLVLRCSDLSKLPPTAQRAARQWSLVLSQSEARSVEPPTETFAWLFTEYTKSAA